MALCDRLRLAGHRRELLVSLSGVDKDLFEATLALFAREAGAGRDRVVILVLDGAGWHTAPGLVVPEGVRLVYLPPYTPELQPAETLWVQVDEPVANKHFETLADLDAAVAAQCMARQRTGRCCSAGADAAAVFFASYRSARPAWSRWRSAAARITGRARGDGSAET